MFSHPVPLNHVCAYIAILPRHFGRVHKLKNINICDVFVLELFAVQLFNSTSQ